MDDTFDFFNPKAGITFDYDRHNNFYLSYAVANREPNRNDYENGNPKPENLQDVELGWRYVNSAFQLNTNVYYMKYKDQLVLTGALNDVGAPIRANVGNSFRLGLEVDANIQLGDKFRIAPNVAVSRNRNQDFVFQRDGELQNLGSTHIAFSPSLVLGNILSYLPKDELQFNLLTKYVGEQFMGNIDSETSLLGAYSQTDLNVQYEIACNGFLDSIVLSGLVNNIFDAKFESNGYFFTFDTRDQMDVITTVEGAGYYPQAGINVLFGATFNF